MKTIISFIIFLIASIQPLISAAQQSNENRQINPAALELNNKAVALMSQSEYDSALHYFDKAIYADSNYYLPHSSKSQIYLFQGQYDKAFAETELVLKLRPDLAEAWTAAGVLIENQGDTVKAMEYYRKSIELYDARISDPDKVDALPANKLNRSVSLILIGEEQDGKDDMIKIGKEFPEHSMLVNEFLKLSRRQIVQTILLKQ